MVYLSRKILNSVFWYSLQTRQTVNIIAQTNLKQKTEMHFDKALRRQTILMIMAASHMTKSLVDTLHRRVAFQRFKTTKFLLQGDKKSNIYPRLICQRPFWTATPPSSWEITDIVWKIFKFKINVWLLTFCQCVMSQCHYVLKPFYCEQCWH